MTAAPPPQGPRERIFNPWTLLVVIPVLLIGFGCWAFNQYVAQVGIDHLVSGWFPEPHADQPSGSASPDGRSSDDPWAPARTGLDFRACDAVKTFMAVPVPKLTLGAAERAETALDALGPTRHPSAARALQDDIGLVADDLRDDDADLARSDFAYMLADYWDGCFRERDASAQVG